MTLTRFLPRLGRSRWPKHLAATGIALIAGWLGISYLVAIQLTGRARQTYAEPAPTIVWGQIQEVRLRTTDEEDIGAWFVPLGNPETPVVLLLHGNGRDRGSSLPMAQLLAERGYATMLLTHRAHGDSTGDVNDFGFSARHDVLAAIEWLWQHEPQRRIIVWGRSLGSAAAIFAARDAGTRVAGYVLECPYQDLYTACRNRTRLYLPWGIEAVAYAGLRIVAPLALPHAARISPLENIQGVPKSVPVLVLTGSADVRARPEEARALADRIRSHCELVVIKGGGHLRLREANADQFATAIGNFLSRSAAEQISRVPTGDSMVR